MSPALSPVRGGALFLRWRFFHRTTIDRETIYPLVVVFIQGDAWNADFGDHGGWAARGGMWATQPSIPAARGGSNDDDLLGFCRSSNNLSIGVGGCSMRRLEAQVPRLKSCCRARQSLGARKQPLFKPKTSENVVPIDGTNCSKSK